MKCHICTLDKSLEEMRPDKRRKDRYHEKICESCFRSKTRLRHKLDKQRYRKDPNKDTYNSYKKWILKRNYNLTPETFDALLLKQGLKCASCGADNPRWSKGWCVDHDHSCCKGLPTCGKCVRGILCMPCNMAAGVMKDNIEDLKGIIVYLKKTKENSLKGPGYSKPDIHKILQ